MHGPDFAWEKETLATFGEVLDNWPWLPHNGDKERS